MAIPHENYVLRLREKDGTLIRMNVLDLAQVSGTERAALIAWAYGSRGIVDTAGFTILRFDPLGNVVGQFSKILCSFNNFECGNFELETGTLLPMADGFLLAGTATHIATGVRHPIAMRMNAAGVTRWKRKYTADIGHPTTARITSAVRMEPPNLALLSAISSEEESWLFAIDINNGDIANSRIQPFLCVRRLRRTTLGVLAVGETNEIVRGPEPIVHALDAVTAAPLWLRTFTWEDQGGDRGVRWFDIAEGKDVLLVVGNAIGHINEIAPWMAFLDKHSSPTPGNLLRAVMPTLDADPVRLRAVVNHQDFVIPLKAGDINSIFVVTGDVQKQPWSFALAEDGTLHWQKKLRVAAGAEGRAVPVIWPSFEEVISGGFYTAGSTQRAFVASSPITNERGTGDCSAETGVSFPEKRLFPHSTLPTDEKMAMQAADWFVDQGRDVDVKKECLNAQ